MKKIEHEFQEDYTLLETDEEFCNMVIEEEVQRFIWTEIQHLSEEQQRVISLHLAGKNNVEIADLLHISINTVKTHKARARQILRIKLKDLFFVTFVLGL